MSVSAGLNGLLPAWRQEEKIERRKLCSQPSRSCEWTLSGPPGVLAVPVSVDAPSNCCFCANMSPHLLPAFLWSLPDLDHVLVST